MNLEENMEELLDIDVSKPPVATAKKGKDVTDCLLYTSDAAD